MCLTEHPPKKDAITMQGRSTLHVEPVSATLLSALTRQWQGKTVISKAGTLGGSRLLIKGGWLPAGTRKRQGRGTEKHKYDI